MINNLPDVNFAEKSASSIETSVITTYEAISGRKLYPADPIRLFLESIALLIVQQRALIDYSAKQNLLGYAQGDFLDHIGVLVGITRLPAAKAQTTLRFTLSAAQNSVLVIPAGTRATVDSSIFFATKDVQNIPVGVTSIDIAAECIEVGTVGNGFLPGQINIMVDPLPWIKAIENTTVSQGGADNESDNDYRGRILIAPEEYSSAGPEGAYISQAKKASTLIQDISVTSPSPGDVEICVLLKNGDIPGVDILDLVHQACNARNVRPLTDNVTVIAPKVVNYAIGITYYIAADRQANALAIQAAVNQAVADFVLWQKTKLGRDINPSELISLIMQAGAKRVVVSAPTDTVLTNNQVAVAQNISASFGGVENE